MTSRWIALLLFLLLGAGLALLGADRFADGVGGEAEPAVALPSVPVTLRLRISNLVTHEPVTGCSIVILDARNEEVARFVGRDPEGSYSLPAPPGAGTIRVTAPGYEILERLVELEPPETELVTVLVPR